MNPNNIPPFKRCKQCGNKFFKKRSEGAPYWGRKSFCSRECKTTSFRGTSPWNKGLSIDRIKYPTMGHFEKHTNAAKERMAAALNNWRESLPPGELSKVMAENQKKAIKVGLARGSYKNNGVGSKEDNPAWKGNKASYNAIHRWIQKNWEKTGTCQECKKETEPFGKRKYGTEWHCKDREYDREVRDTWVEVCPKCHRKLDKLWIQEEKILE